MVYSGSRESVRVCKEEEDKKWRELVVESFRLIVRSLVMVRTVSYCDSFLSLRNVMPNILITAVGRDYIYLWEHDLRT